MNPYIQQRAALVLQRIAIAEACGWRLRDPEDPSPSEQQYWTSPDGRNHVFPHNLPDYLSDLNAMHEAEKVLTEMQWHRYLQELAKVVREKGQAEIRIAQYVRATAAQRAEAFLRTIDKWSDDK